MLIHILPSIPTAHMGDLVQMFCYMNFAMYSFSNYGTVTNRMVSMISWKHGFFVCVLPTSLGSGKFQTLTTQSYAYLLGSIDVQRNFVTNNCAYNFSCRHVFFLCFLEHIQRGLSCFSRSSSNSAIDADYVVKDSGLY